MQLNTIHRAKILPFGMLNAFVVQGPAGCILVDTGLPGTEKVLGRLLAKNGLMFSDINLIVVTHAHVDHAGNARLIQQLSGAPILAHQGDLAYYRREQPMHFCATGWFGRLFFKAGLIQAPYQGFSPDILLSNDEEFCLGEFGFKGKVIPTPGHTMGSISVVLDSQQALVGDLVSSGILLGGILFKQRPKRPPFEENPTRVANELDALVQAGIQQFYLGHGGPLNNLAVSTHVRRLEQLDLSH